MPSAIQPLERVEYAKLTRVPCFLFRRLSSLPAPKSNTGRCHRNNIHPNRYHLKDSTNLRFGVHLDVFLPSNFLFLFLSPSSPTFTLNESCIPHFRHSTAFLACTIHNRTRPFRWPLIHFLGGLSTYIREGAAFSIVQPFRLLIHTAAGVEISPISSSAGLRLYLPSRVSPSNTIAAEPSPQILHHGVCLRHCSPWYS
jgi:hypothetical protein